MNHGQQMAVMLLAGERMGYATGSASIARDILEGRPVHVMFFATIESEAIELHNTLRKQPELVDKANQHCADLIKEYGLDKKAERRSAPGRRLQK